ncbi:type I-D CRISPR-associated helicase Cas3' [Candidatus Viridilinea mediisalina]|uniref:Type I-D CRISPR-associated helicase Cas3 n=1 Tax=Candidatus Viridilinea mediisalina TaxID=2024553 RepID=A0A2A6REY2_9CHLR|nr:type I-D CRISPR-associated helicase Cas3' [Candidatus Viridilinea mediisalina]PDW01378.1 type I-D CRISPR-associated helicase Cas3' [Candidatus Viridilinea mediisalina]
MQIVTLPVYSKLADATRLPAKLAACLPQGYQLSQHQVETYEALCSDDLDVVINTAMTGDGKSLAAYLPTLLDPKRGAFGMYPTNELALDQRRQFDDYNKAFASQLTFTSLSGERLGTFIAERPEFERRAEALAALMADHQVLLSNPDMFHLMINYRYGSKILSIQELPALVNAYYKHFIFDEFHTFSTPQMVAAITAMLFLCATAGANSAQRPRFLFSSATPNAVFAKLLRQSGLRVKEIQGSYSNTDGDEYRQVLHGTKLTLHQLSEAQNLEQWIKNNLALIENHWSCADGPRPRGVIIVNSVVEARRIARMLSEQCKHLKIGENTGLTDSERRHQAMREADLIVGTSTIDIGIDFNISLLIFEAPDAGAFLQRFGRLGRVRRNEVPFANYEAHALFNSKTPWIYDNLSKALKDRQIDAGDVVDRPVTLRDAVLEAFPTTTSFQRYIKRWGALQAAHLIAGLEDKRLAGSHAEVAHQLRQQYQQTLDLKSMGGVLYRYRQLLNGKNEPASPQCKALLDEVLSFRGSSPFQAVLWDDTTEPATFLSYDALVIAQNSDLTLADAEPFHTALKERYADEQTRHAMLERFRYALTRNGEPLVLYVEAFWSERERLILQIDHFEPSLQLNEAILLTGISIKQPRNEETKQLNMVLRKQRVVGYITRKEPAELRRKLKLPSFFPLYQIQDSYEQTYTLALGQAALLLEAEALWMKNKDEETAPIIC